MLGKLASSPDIKRSVFFLFAALVAVALKLLRLLNPNFIYRRRDKALWPFSPPQLEPAVSQESDTETGTRSQGVQTGSGARLDGGDSRELELEKAKSLQMLSLGTAALERVAELEKVAAAQEETISILAAEKVKLLSEVAELKTSLAATQDALFVASSSALGLACTLEGKGMDPGHVVERIDHDRIYQKHCLSVGSLNSTPATARYFAQLGQLFGVPSSGNVLLQVVKRHSRFKR